jgi:histidyl-tRNA synthetase
VTPLGDAGPDDAAKMRFVRRRAEAVFRAHGYRELGPGLVDAEGRPRADAIASLARVHVQGLDGAQPPRFARRFMSGPLVDPTAAVAGGRLRWPSYDVCAGAIFGVAGPLGDAEMCALALALTDDPGLTHAELAVNTLGEPADLARYLADIAELLPLRCPVCEGAADALRFFTCDEEGCRALAATAPPVREHASTPALKHHEAFLATLEASGVTVRDDPRLAFGAERHARTILELRARTADGATVAIARGGRRDALCASFGASLPAIGLTIGLGRAAACVGPADASFEPACELFIAAQGAGARAWAFRVAAAERGRGFRVDVDLGDGGWADQLARAGEVNARVVIVCGEVERKAGEVAVRDMATREVRRLPEAELASEIKRLLR